ncbi:MAG: hypothetical protein HXS54_03040 [Theionarchaea archaeon]|nr:hypothetical protein [Theionarchaea archaeon]
MKCINCGKDTDEGKVVCQGCLGVDRYDKFLRIHVCNSFIQMESEVEGVCQYVLLCAPIKKALESEALIVPFQGHIVCPYPGINLGYILYKKFSRENLEKNYSEYLD